MKLFEYLKTTYHIAEPGDATWCHAVNSIAKLDRSLIGNRMMIESDICLSLAQGIPVAAHPPKTESNLTFTGLINRMKHSEKGLKLDFKDPEILPGCLKTLHEAALSQPVVLNADILTGNGAKNSRFRAEIFLTLCRKYYPEGILSIGWTTTAYRAFSYTRENVNEMLALSKNVTSEITFPVRGCLLPNSWNEIKRLLEANPHHTLTIWNNGTVSDTLRNWIQTNTDPGRTFYDFVDSEGEPLDIP